MFEPYQKFCNFFGFIKVGIPKGLEQRYEEALTFAHVKITPQKAFSTAIFFPLFFFVVGTFLLFLFSVFSLATLLIVGLASAVAFYYLYNYPFYARDVFRIKASEEMIFCILYMATALRISPNLENAVRYARENLEGVLAQDLQELLWKVYTRQYASFNEGFEKFMAKWRSDYEEFAEALYLLKNSIGQSPGTREKTINEAIDFMLSGTKQSMKDFAAQLKTPITIINALGILLPIVGLVFFPFVAIFMPETFKPIIVFIGYNVALPLAIYFLASSYLRKRSYSFHAVKLKIKKIELFYLLPFFAFSLGASYFIFLASRIKAIFAPEQLYYSLIAVLLLGIGIAVYFYFSARKKLKVKKKIERVEDEFIEALYQLSNIVARGTPMERSLEELTLKIKNLEISSFFRIILNNIRTFGMNLYQAIFDPKFGAIQKYSSSLIKAVMKAIAEISKKSFSIVAKILKDVSTYLKNMKEVDNSLRELLQETTSSMRIQALLLAPLSAAVVVAITALMISLLLKFGEVATTILQKTGPLQVGSQVLLTSFVNLKEIMPFYVFQLVVGIYLLEVVILISYFLSTINHGSDEIAQKVEIAKNLFFAVILYAIIAFVTYTAFSSVVEGLL